MLLPYRFGTVLLQGLISSKSECSMLQIFNVALDAAESIACILPQVQDLLDEFNHLFAEPSSLPP